MWWQLVLRERGEWQERSFATANCTGKEKENSFLCTFSNGIRGTSPFNALRSFDLLLHTLLGSLSEKQTVFRATGVKALAQVIEIDPVILGKVC